MQKGIKLKWKADGVCWAGECMLSSIVILLLAEKFKKVIKEYETQPLHFQSDKAIKTVETWFYDTVWVYTEGFMFSRLNEEAYIKYRFMLHAHKSWK